MSPDQCFCRGAGICDNNHHICEDCTCDHDGAPQETPTYGHVNATQTRLDAWQTKWRLTR
jgi:hypothetical protein